MVDLILAVSVLYYLFDAYMALITAAILECYLWSSMKILSKQEEKQGQWCYDVVKEQSILREATEHWYTASYFNRIPHEQSRYSSALKDRMRSSLAYTIWGQFRSVIESALLTSGLTLAFFKAANRIVQGTKPIGSIIMLITYWHQLWGPIQFFSDRFSDIILKTADAEGLIQLLKQEPKVVDRPGAKALTLDGGRIEFKNVKFSYNDRKTTLEDINFQLPPGKTTAIVGESGGGKSTILKMILRFHDPQRGTVEIDGQNIRDITLDSLRGNIGVVPQHTALFHNTIMNNIKYAKDAATDEEVFEACKAVGLHEKILGFAEGYQTLVGERGVKLSGGELQRVAIARVMLKDPKIVLLDEATSSLDSETESKILESIQKLTAGRTTVVIAYVVMGYEFHHVLN
ncbi:hypothetical protein VTN00DRAFT_2732 [Thermoascus crustaceus]|uniref:uncharacterized protein n=1 Tax=Thermoascus crustaceus TaxID=5088 RepID=UPI00374471D9